MQMEFALNPNWMLYERNNIVYKYTHTRRIFFVQLKYILNMEVLFSALTGAAYLAAA